MGKTKDPKKNQRPEGVFCHFFAWREKWRGLLFCALSWISFENAGRLVWLSFSLLGSVGFRGEIEKTRPGVIAVPLHA